MTLNASIRQGKSVIFASLKKNEEGPKMRPVL